MGAGSRRARCRARRRCTPLCTPLPAGPAHMRLPPARFQTTTRPSLPGAGLTAAVGLVLIEHHPQQAAAVQQHGLLAAQAHVVGGHKLERGRGRRGNAQGVSSDGKQEEHC